MMKYIEFVLFHDLDRVEDIIEIECYRTDEDITSQFAVDLCIWEKLFELEKQFERKLDFYCKRVTLD